jgi:hypothetical protein
MIDKKQMHCHGLPVWCVHCAVDCYKQCLEMLVDAR